MRLLFLITMLSVAFISCKKDDDNPTTNDTSGVSTGTWKVSLFTDSGKNETANFSSYSFTFKNDGTATANDKPGTWSINSSKTKFNINFGEKSDANKPLGELTDDWVIISVTSNEIKLKDDNEDSGEFLTFTR
jgi:hypothetical protein